MTTIVKAVCTTTVDEECNVTVECVDCDGAPIDTTGMTEIDSPTPVAGSVTVDGDINIAGPIDVVITNPVIPVTPGEGWSTLFDDLGALIEASLLAQTDAITADLQAICDKLEAGITVTALQGGDWTVALDADTINGILDGFADALADVQITLDPASLQALADLLDGLNVNATITNDPLTVTVDGEVQVAGWNDLIAGLQDIVNTLNAGIDINSLPEVVISAQSIADLVTALEAATLTVTLAGEVVDVNITNNPLTVTLDQAALDALENITVTVDTTNGPVEITGEVTIDQSGGPLQVEFDYAALAAALDGLNVNATVTNFAELATLLDGLTVTIGNQPVVTIDPAQFQSLLDAVMAAVRCDWEPVPGACIVDSDDNQVGLTGVFTQRCWDHQGTLVSSETVLSRLLENGTWEAYTLAAGERVVPCPPKKDTECRESQEWTYGIDNTGTDYRWTQAKYELELSDGSTLVFEQSTAANGGWTPQMQEWGDNIQAAADAAGLAWFVETRFRDPSNPDSLAGGGGFAGPPSVAVSNALKNMLWRYVNIQICPGQPVPVAARVIEVEGVARDQDLTNDGAVLGPISKFKVCTTCGESDVWYLADGVTLAESGQIPNCWEPCGTLALTDAPPDRDCTFETVIGCDNNNQEITANFTQDITRIAKICNGVEISAAFYQQDPADATALIDYTMTGQFVDCATGEPIPLPQPACESQVGVGTLWRLKDNADIGTNIDYWGGTTAYPGGGNAAAHDNVSNIFVSDGATLVHSNGAPDISYVSPVFEVASTSAAQFLADVGVPSSAETNATDQLRLSGYVVMPSPGLLRDSNPNTGERGGIAINLCCAGELEYFQERTSDTVSGDVGVFDGVRVPAGIHYIEAVTSDLSAWQGLALDVSYDDGNTYEPFTSFLTKPEYECIPTYRCLPAGTLHKVQDGSLIELLDTDKWCKPAGCEPSTLAESAADDAVTALCDGSEGFKVEVVKHPIQYHTLTGGGVDGLRNREWTTAEPVATATVPLGRALREAFDLSVAPTIDNVSADLTFNDTDNTAAVRDYQLKEGFFVVDQPMMIRYTGSSEGYWAMELGRCCGPLELEFEMASSIASVTSPPIMLPAGIHQVRLWNIDAGGSNSSKTAQYSLDGGITWTNDNTPPGVQLKTAKPSWQCLDGYLCGEDYTDLAGDPIVFDANTVRCKPDCVPSSGGGGSADTSDAMAAVQAERDSTQGGMQIYRNTNAVETLPVPAGTRGCLVSITEHGTGSMNYTIDGTAPTTNSASVSVQYGNYIRTCGIDLSLVRLKGTSAQSDYTVTWEAWT